MEIVQVVRQAPTHFCRDPGNGCGAFECEWPPRRRDRGAGMPAGSRPVAKVVEGPGGRDLSHGGDRTPGGHRRASAFTVKAGFGDHN